MKPRASSVRLSKEEIDLVYHLLRKASLSEEKPYIRAISKHLLTSGDYFSLQEFSGWYGSTFLAPKVAEIAKSFLEEVIPDVIIELGAGRSKWFGTALSEKLRAPLISVDKREEFSPDLVLDLEEPLGCIRLKGLLDSYTHPVIAMADLLHCLSATAQGSLLNLLWRHEDGMSLILEYDTSLREYGDSFIRQTGEKGCCFAFLDFIERYTSCSYSLPPYRLWVIA